MDGLTLALAVLDVGILAGMWLYLRAIRHAAERTVARSNAAITELRELRRLNMQAQLAVTAERFSEARFLRLLEVIRDAYVAADEEGRIIGWNSAAALMFQRSKDDAMGLPIQTLMPHRLREDHSRGFERFVRTRGASVNPERYIDSIAVDADGDEIPVRVVMWSTELPDAVVCNALIHRREE